MWKFILFIIIAAVAVWQGGLLDKMVNLQQKNATPSAQIETNVEQNNTNQPEKTEVEVSKVETAVITPKTETEPKAETSKVKEVVEVQKKNEPEVKVTSLEDIPADNVEESKEEEVAKKPEESKDELSVSSIQGNLKNLMDEETTQEVEPKATSNKKEISSLVREVKDSEEYEDLLMSEAGDDGKEEVANSKSVTAKSEMAVEVKKEDKELTAYEKMLMDEVGNGNDDTADNREITFKQKKLELSGNALRDRLKTLLVSAKKVIDRDADADLAKADGDMANSVKVQTKTDKDMLNSLVLSATKSDSQAKNAYVVNLLSEVANDKIKVLDVQEDYTLIKVKAGDTLSTIAMSIYGDGKKYLLIFEANKDILATPDSIYAGIELKIPTIK